MTTIQTLFSGTCAVCRRLRLGLASPVDGASLALFRIGFGLVMFWYLIKFIWPIGGPNRLTYFYVNVGWNFPYPGFEWVRGWPEPFLTMHFLVVALAALLVAAGLFYRLAAWVLFLGYTYIFLLDSAKYNNHYYLMSLVAFLLACMPANACWSIDAWWRKRRRPDSTAGGRVPFWPIFLLRAQLFVMYFFGGIAKLNADWLTGVPLKGPATKMIQFWQQYVALPEFIAVKDICLFMAWGGLVFDLSIGFLLLFRRTRFLGFLLTAFFHTWNHFLFPIGVFPILALASTLILFEPDWPRRFWAWLRRPRLAKPDWGWLVGGALVVPGLGAALGWRCRPAAMGQAARPLPMYLTAFVGLFVAGQFLLPFRHYFQEGDANWTEQGQRFAWRMMLRAKAANYLLIYLQDPKVQIVDEKGRPQMNWDGWPGEGAGAIHVTIDSHRFQWADFPGLNVIYEPCLGLRAISYPIEWTPARGGLEAARASLIGQWRECFGREPVIHQTVSLQQAIQDALAALEAQGQNDQEVAATAAKLAAALVLAEFRAEDLKMLPEKRLVSLVDTLRAVLRSPHGPLARRHLSRVHPFAFQGADFPNQTFLIVEDPLLKPEDFRKLSGDAPYLVWTDIARLRPDDWKGLPRQFVTYEQGELRILWNYFKELNQLQIERFSVRADMIHQYAQRIAGLWEADTGRRPEVHVLSNVMLNYRRPQPLIDPQADLASLPLNIFRRNSWILPLQSPVLNLGSAW